MADLIFDKLAYHISVGNIDLENDSLKIALVKDTYTPDSTDEVWSDISDDECDATGYTAGGKAIENVAITEAAGVTTVDADDPALWASLTGTGIKYAVVYDTTYLNTLVCLFELSQVRAPSAENLAITFHADGLFDMAA